MSDPVKKIQRISNPKGFGDLIRSNVESNNRNHRPQSQQLSTNRTYVSSQQNQDHIQNGKLVAKPLLDCLKPEPLLITRPFDKSMIRRRRRNKQFDNDRFDRSDDDQNNNGGISSRKIEIDRSTIDVREPTSEHLSALKNAINRVLKERSLSNNSLKQRQLIFSKLNQLIKNLRQDSRAYLYGSVYFECCLEKPGSMDIDVQFKEKLQYDTLKEILDIIQKGDLCKEAEINTEHKPACIDLITNEPNMRVRITSGYNRGLQLSKLIRLYTKFDPRLIKLLRLFRILSKTCNIDKPDLGTLHPVVFHIMVIHFLQQLDEPVLPSLHEYAYGVDHVPLTLNENQYPEFFHVCEKYSHEWKSKNTTSVEMLFLQILSYYVKTFNTKQFVVSIQTRMPVLKIDKNWRTKKFLVEDPTDVKRSLCHTMQSIRSIDYFRSVLNASLNYFARKQISKKCLNASSVDNRDDDLIEIVPDEKDDIPTNEPSNSLHNSYKLFYKRLPPTVIRDVNIKQGRVREYYKRTFDNQKNKLPSGLIKLNSSIDQLNDLDINDIEEAFQHDLESNFQVLDENDDDQNDNDEYLSQRIVSNEYEDEQFLNESLQNSSIVQQEDIIQQESSNSDEEESIDKKSPAINDSNEQGDLIRNKENESHIQSTAQLSEDESSTSQLPILTESEASEQISLTSKLSSSPINIKNNSIIIDDDDSCIPSPFASPILLEQILEIEKSTVDPSTATDNSNELFYDFQAENFHAEQGAPYVCATCNGVGHLKTECPELFIPNVIDLPVADKQWIKILSILCQRITEQRKPKDYDEENRRRILVQLEKQIQKDYPDCNLHAFGSFYNGFGFRESDLDVCIVFKDGREQNKNEVIQMMQRILRSMRSSNSFDNIQPVLHAKVPIIRSRHRYLHIEIDVSLHNMLAIENTRLLKTYTEIDSRVSELGYMIKHLVKICGIGDASRGTLSSYAYIIMVIHFLQQIKPAVLPVLQQLNDPNNKRPMHKKCSEWNVYFYDDLSKIKELWKNENQLSTGALWIEFLRFYTEQFNYDEHVITIRQIKPLLKQEKNWFRQAISIEDPFELSHDLAGGLTYRNWIMIRRVLIRARQQFGVQPANINIHDPDMSIIEETLFNIDDLCPTNAPKRCEWCKGPYHIRKRCPKLASLANENIKKSEAFNYFDTQVSTNNRPKFQSNNNREYLQDNFNGKGYNHSKFVPLNQRSNRYTTNERTRGLQTLNYNSSEQQTTNPSRTMEQNDFAKECYNCRNFGHLKAQCPFPKKNYSIKHKKFSN